MIECFEEKPIVQAEKPADEPAKTDDNSTGLTGWRLALAIIIPIITAIILIGLSYNYLPQIYKDYKAKKEDYKAKKENIIVYNALSKIPSGAMIGHAG